MLAPIALLKKRPWLGYWGGVIVLCVVSVVVGEMAGQLSQADPVERLMFYAGKPFAAVLFGGGIVYIVHRELARSRGKGLTHPAATAWWWTLGLELFALSASPEVRSFF